MWRNITRNLQQGFKRSLGFAETPENCIKDGKASCSNLPKSTTSTEVLPGAFQHLNHSVLKTYFDHGQGDYYQRTSNIGQHSFFEAFGWSGALVFGWVISKHLWLSHTWGQKRDDKNELRKCKQESLLKLLGFIIKTQPPASFVLPQLEPPQLVKSAPGSGDKTSTDLDEEFESAAKELEIVHNRAIAEALNRRGIACLSKPTAFEALKYFRRASDLKYAPASFNMGQCCELGIGTKQNFKQAAEWYRVASDQGHATATYNLGVFYAHGWGGLQANVEIAKQLFGKAAKLGQPDAKAALEREAKFKNIKIFQKAKDGAETQLKSHEIDLILNNIRNGLTDGAIQMGFSNEKHWNIPINSTIAF